MSSLSAKDRVSLCSFSFSDGRRCRTPRISNHPHFCFYHAQKEARALAAQKLGKDLAYFFSGDYLSACDLSTALSRLVPAVVRGDVKPKAARTVAYLMQTLVQAIHISQHEYINAFGTDGWRKSVRNSVNGNYDYLFPFTPSEAEGPATDSDHAPEPEQSHSPQPQPQPAVQPASVAHTGIHSACPDLVEKRSDECLASSPSPESHRREPAFSSHSPLATSHSPLPSASAPSPTSPPAPQTPAAHTAPSHTAGHPRRSERSCLNHAASTISKTNPVPATQPGRSATPAALSEGPQQTSRSAPQPAPNRDAHAVHFDHNCCLLIDGKPF